MERAAFARARKFLNYYPFAKWSALVAAVGTGGIRRPVEECPHIAVFNRAAKQSGTLDHEFGTEDGAVSGLEHAANRSRKAHFVRCEWSRTRHAR